VIKGFFDELFHGGDVVFLYSRPQTGITALQLKLLLEFSESERPVLYVSSRTDPMKFKTRIVSMMTGIPLTRLMDGQLFGSDLCALTKFFGRLLNGKTFHASHHLMDALEVRQKMHLWRYQQNVHRGLLLYDDYVDLSITDPGDFEQNIADLKSLAKDTNTLLLVTVRLGEVPFQDYDFDRLFSFKEFPGEQFAKRVVMKREEDKVVVRVMSCPEQSGRALELGYNWEKDSLEYFL
jgi:replicative DNA helicase